MMWNQNQQPGGIPWQLLQMLQQQYPMLAPPSNIPPQVLVAFKLLENLNHKQSPIIAVSGVGIEVVDGLELLPVEEEARVVSLHLLMAYMKSAMQ